MPVSYGSMKLFARDNLTPKETMGPGAPVNGFSSCCSSNNKEAATNCSQIGQAVYFTVDFRRNFGGHSIAPKTTSANAASASP